MILSMTGFGDAQYAENGVSYVLEIRSLNNRYFKPAFKLPEHCQSHEGELDKLLRKRMERGIVILLILGVLTSSLRSGSQMQNFRFHI